MRNIMLLIFSFILVFIIYEIFIVRKAKKDKRKKPMEVKYLINRYNINIKDIDYNKLLNVIALVSSLDIAIVVTIANLINNYLLMVLVSIILMLVLILISYEIVGRIYRKK